MNKIHGFITSSNLKGHGLVQPLLSYHGAFRRTVDHGSPLIRVAKVIAWIATGIFAYPILGTLALIGLSIKAFDIPNLRRHNQNQWNHLKRQLQQLETRTRDTHTVFLALFSSPMQTVIKIPVDEIHETVKETCPWAANNFRKIYIGDITLAHIRTPGLHVHNNTYTYTLAIASAADFSCKIILDGCFDQNSLDLLKEIEAVVTTKRLR
jgi:hypothetical protein